jgi:hypothetical protein
MNKTHILFVKIHFFKFDFNTILNSARVREVMVLGERKRKYTGLTVGKDLGRF